MNTFYLSNLIILPLFQLVIFYYTLAKIVEIENYLLNLVICHFFRLILAQHLLDLHDYKKYVV